MSGQQKGPDILTCRSGFRRPEPKRSQESQNNAATGALAISGTPTVEETLMADTCGIDDQNGLNNVSNSYYGPRRWQGRLHRRRQETVR